MMMAKPKRKTDEDVSHWKAEAKKWRVATEKAEQQAKAAWAKADEWEQFYQAQIIQNQRRAAIQSLDNFTSKTEAESALAMLRQMGDFLGGRVYQAETGFRLQSFWRFYPEAVHWLPEGNRAVLIPRGQERALGIERPLEEQR